MTKKEKKEKYNKQKIAMRCVKCYIYIYITHS